MTSEGRHRRVAALAIAALAAACVSAPVAGAKYQPANGDLSSRLAELAKPSVRKAPPGRQAKILDVAPDGPGSLLREGGRVLVDVRFDRGAVAGVRSLRDAGAKIVHVSRRYQTVTAAVAPGLLRKVSEIPRVGAVTENLAPVTFAAGDSGPITSAITHCFGTATSEGDTQLNAMLARDAFELDGSGVTVGILSDSFDTDSAAPTHAIGDVASGDLPGPVNPCERWSLVNVLEDYTPSTTDDPDPTDEGRAMAQIVHDLAPGASLAFATAFKGINAFASNIRALRDAGARVIVDDVIYLEEPFFQEGPVGVAVSEVAPNAAYFTSAGNGNLISGGDNFASWETPAFRDSNGCPAGVPPDTVQCLDFDPGASVDQDFGITVGAGRTLRLDLQWSQPWFGVTADLDAYLLDSSGTRVAASDESNIDQRPFELIVWRNNSASPEPVRLVINRCFGDPCNPGADPNAKPRLKLILVQNGGGVSAPEYPKSSDPDIVGPTIFGHSGAEDAMSVGAIRFNTRSAPEAFSSRGPVVHYFGPVTGPTPAAPLTPEKTLSKPELVATDGGANTFFGTCASNIWRFFGTSASAPHAAAIAALELQAAPGSSPSEIKDAQINTAFDLGLPATAVGAGIVDAYGAVDSLAGGSPPGSQATQSTAQNCPPTAPPEPVPAPPPEPPTTTTVFSGPAAKKKDRKRPQTWIAKRPKKRSFTKRKARRVVFRFRSNEKGSAYLCKIDRKRFHQCYRKLIRWFRLGRHVLRVKAKDRAGNVDRSPAVYRFWIKRRR